MKPPKSASNVSLRTRFAVPPATTATDVPSVLSGPLCPVAARRPRYVVPAVALLAGIALLTAAPRTQAAPNTADPVLAGATDLGLPASYTTTPTTTSDVEFLAATTYANAGAFGLSAALSIGTLDDFNATAIAINGTGLLTLNTTANSVAPNASDLLYVVGGGSLSIQTSGGITFAATGSVDDAGTLSLGTSPITIATGTTLSFLGAGATTVGGNIAATNGNVVINDAGGSVTFSGTNAYTGTTTIYNGALLSADATSAIGTGAVTLNPGATLRTLSTSGGSLGGGAFALNTSTIQVGNGTVANPSATLPGALALQGGNSTINLQDNGSGTATLKFTSTTTPSRVNGATLIVNGATALDGATDVLNFGPTAGGNAAAPNVITNGVFPGYELGTVGGSANAGFLTTTTGAVGGNVKLYSIPVANQFSSQAAAAFTSTGVYSLGGTNTITSTQSAYDLQFNSGATLAIGGNTLNIGGGSGSTGTLLFNGTGDAVTGTGAIAAGAGELVLYTGGTATIGAPITSSSGGPFVTFFGPGTLTLTSTVKDSNGSGNITFNGNVIANLTSAFSNDPVAVNGGTLTLGLANIFNGTTGAALTVNALGTLDLHGNNTTVSNLNGGSSALVLGGTITNTTGSATLALNNTNGNYYGSITNASSDPISVIKYGSNTQNLQGALSYTGTTTLVGGQLTFAPAGAGVNDSLGALTFSQGAGTVQSNYQGTGTTTLTFANLTARTAGTGGNFATSGGTNGTTNKIVLTQFNGATPTAGTVLDPGYFFGGNAYATVDAGGFLRAYVSTDTNGVNATGTNAIASNAASNVFLTGSVSGQASATVNTVNLGNTQSLTLNSGATFGTNGVIGSGLGGINGGSLTTAASGGELVVRWGGSNQIVITSSVVDKAGGSSSVTDAGGSVYLNGTNTYTGVTTVNNGTLFLGGNTAGGSTATGDLGASSSVVLNSGGNLSFYRSTPYTFTNPITSGASYSTNTVTQAGTAALTLGSITNTGTANTFNVTRNAGTGAFTLGTLNGIGTVTDNSTAGATTPTTITQTGTGLTIGTLSANANGAVINFGGTGSTTIGTINGVSGGTVNLSGTGTTTVTGNVNTVGEVVNFNSGTVSLTNSGNFQSSLHFNGATVTTTSTNQNFNSLVSLTTTAGTFTDSSGYGLRLGGAFGAVGQGTGNNFSGTQTGGTVTTPAGGNNNSFELGSNSNGFTDTYALSGGTLNAPQIDIGNGTGGTGTSSFTLSGTGKVLSSTTIQGGQGNGAIQNFVFAGGTLAAAAVNFTNLTTSGATTGTASTFTNAGGVLAPGDIGTAGRTVITGSYAVTSANAGLAVDLGTTTQGSGFQTGGYDYTTVSGTTALGGRLNVGLIGGFATTAPTSANTFTILSSAGALSGTFNNLQVVNPAGASAGNFTGAGAIAVGTAAFNTVITTGAGGSVVLNNYTTGNTYTGNSTAWDAATASSWSVYDPGSSTTLTTPVATGAVAQFGNGDTTVGVATVSLNSTRNVAGILFNSTNTGATNYTINDAGNGTGAIVLDNTASNAAATIADSSAAGNANAINVPITLNSPLAVSVTNATNTLALGGVLSGAQPLTKTGLGTLVLGNANTYSGTTTLGVNAGNIRITNASALGSGSVALTTTNSQTSASTLQIALTGGTLAAPNVIANNFTGNSQNTLTSGGTANIENVSGFNELTGTYTLTGTGGSGQNVVADAGSSLQLAGPLSVNGPTGNRAFDFGGAGNIVVSGVFSNGTATGVLQKDGVGTLTLSAANTYTGTTTVNAGVLLVNGSVGATATPAGAVTVSGAGTLGGAGMLTVANATINGTLAPGATIGATSGTLTLNTTAGLTLGGNLIIGVLGSGSTTLATNGSLTLSGVTLTLNGALDGVSNYDVAKYGGTLTGTFAGFTAPAGYTINYAGTSFGTSDIELDAVPEPSTIRMLAMLGLGGLVMALRKRLAKV